jgi:hypothetical protein
MPGAGRITEAEVATAVLRVLANERSGEDSMGTIRQQLKSYLSLSAEDQQPSLTRENEELWEQQVRNFVNHRCTTGNFIRDGLIEYRSDSMTITDAGRSYVSSKGLG